MFYFSCPRPLSLLFPFPCCSPFSPQPLFFLEHTSWSNPVLLSSAENPTLPPPLPSYLNPPFNARSAPRTRTSLPRAGTANLQESSLDHLFQLNPRPPPFAVLPFRFFSPFPFSPLSRSSSFNRNENASHSKRKRACSAGQAREKDNKQAKEHRSSENETPSFKPPLPRPSPPQLPPRPSRPPQQPNAPQPHTTPPS